MIKSFLKHVIFVLLTLIFSSGQSNATDYVVAPPPSWVDSVTINATRNAQDAFASGIELLLFDMQTKVDPNSSIYFKRHVTRILKKESIPDVANIEIKFDPKQQKIILHQVSIRRGSQTHNQILPHNIRVLQRESRSEEQIYTGVKSLVIFLEDVRVGDIIDYSFSLENRDPEYNNNFYQFIPLVNYYPVAQLRNRLLWGRERPLDIKNHSTTLKPTIKSIGGSKEYIWTLNNVKKLEIEDSMPSWYIPYPWIEVSEGATWHDIALKNLEIYKIPETVSPEIEKFVESVAREHHNKSDQLREALRFIQDEIRYMSLPMDNSLPTDPSIVFQRRYGDCREKSLLAVTVLKKLGISSSVALVDTLEGKVLKDVLPHFGAFDHALITVSLDGKRYFFDPTTASQKGSLENYTNPNYGYALIVDSETRDLRDMTSFSSLLAFHAVYETIDLSKGFEAPALLTVQSIVKGKRADNLREYLSSMESEKIQGNYLSYYKELYPTLTLKEDLKVEDDIEKNEIILTETYEIESPGVLDSSKRNLTFSHSANEIFSYISEEVSLPRKTPLDIYYPIYFLKHITILLPEEARQIETENVEVTDSSFSFRKLEEVKNNQFTIFYEYKALVDHVSPKNAEEYSKNITKVRESLGGGLTYPVPSQSVDSINWPMLLLSSIIALIWTYIAYRIYLFKPKNLNETPPSSKYQGLGGWLLIPILALIVSFVQEALEVSEYLSMILSHETWSLILDPSQVDYSVYKAPFLLSTLLFIIGEMIFAILLMCLFFNKKVIFPKVYICFIWVCQVANIFIEIVNVNLLQESTQELKKAISMVFGSIIWTAYFVYSKRVKATFIHP